ncbi:MAG: terpene cyclase/mutase family protein [Kiritimatiellaeota bacterium]|nr:terpene cyclase/mutase family protein [Kiritimatiellota bacterium]
MKKTIVLSLAGALSMLPVHAQLDAPELRDKVDAAITKGLDFIVSQQRPDGAFPEGYGESAAVPALAGMAFLSRGHLPDLPPYGDVVNRCIDYVVTCPDATGYMGAKAGGQMYAHCIATLFLSECSGMVSPERQVKINEVLPKASKVILDAQKVSKGDRDRGGWRYQPTSGDSDMSCSGWALMALRSIRLNGGAVPPESIAEAVEYVKRHHSASRGGFGYQGPGEALPLCGAGILCLELCGHHNDPASLKTAEFLMGGYERFPNEGNGFYGMYYASQALFQLGGDYWKKFSAWMYATWLPLQKPDGSWNKGENGPVYQTAMCILSLAVPYRQLPIYQRDETVDDD